MVARPDGQLRHRDLAGAAVRRAAARCWSTSSATPASSRRGFTSNPDIPIAKSITDYIFRWLALKFLPSEQAGGGGAWTMQPARRRRPSRRRRRRSQLPGAERRASTYLNQADAPPCHTCGAIMVRSGACYKCSNCGATSGCS